MFEPVVLESAREIIRFRFIGRVGPPSQEASELASVPAPDDSEFVSSAFMAKRGRGRYI